MNVVMLLLEAVCAFPNFQLGSAVSGIFEFSVLNLDLGNNGGIDILLANLWRGEKLCADKTEAEHKRARNDRREDRGCGSAEGEGSYCLVLHGGLLYSKLIINIGRNYSKSTLALCSKGSFGNGKKCLSLLMLSLFEHIFAKSIF